MSGLLPARSYRRLRRVCARCKATWADGHVCHDHLRHPRFDDLLDALSRAVDHASGSRQLHNRIEAGGLPDVPMRAEETLAFQAVLEVALLWEHLPPWEKAVVNAVLEHAGVPKLAA